MLLDRLIVNFIFFSFCGWIYECIYCTCRTRHWQNRGFLFGPICPIYGFGVIAVELLAEYVPAVTDGQLPVWAQFLLFAAGSAVLEYVTSWILEKRYHARWWDYSKVPLNIHGRIALPITAAFGLAGVLILRYIMPLLAEYRPETHPLLDEVLALVFMMILGADLALSAASMSQLIERLEQRQDSLNARMESRVQAVQKLPETIREDLAASREREPRVLRGLHVHHLRNVRIFTSAEISDDSEDREEMQTPDTLGDACP